MTYDEFMRDTFNRHDEPVNDYEYKVRQILNSVYDSNRRKSMIGALGLITNGAAVADAHQKMAAYETLCSELSQLNTMRGGVKGFKGFVGESMQAANATAAGRMTSVVNDNGAVDLIFSGKNGRSYPQQLKIGYKPGQIDFQKYRGQTVIVDKGNPHLRALQAEGRACGVKVVEGTVTEAEAKRWADAMQFECKITGNSRAYIVPQTQKFMNDLAAMHEAGLSVGKSGAMYGAGFSIGSNIVKMMRGDVGFDEAAVNIARDTAMSGAIGYGVGAVGSG